MNKAEYFKQLRLRKEQILKELASIDVLLADDDSAPIEPVRSVTRHVENNFNDSSLNYITKGKKGWEEYVMTLIKALGTPIKSALIIEYAVPANPKIPRERVIDSVRGTISRLAKDGYLIAEKGASKYEGYTYTINPEKAMELAA